MTEMNKEGRKLLVTEDQNRLFFSFNSLDEIEFLEYHYGKYVKLFHMSEPADRLNIIVNLTTLAVVYQEHAQNYEDKSLSELNNIYLLACELIGKKEESNVIEKKVLIDVHELDLEDANSNGTILVSILNYLFNTIANCESPEVIAAGFDKLNRVIMAMPYKPKNLSEKLYYKIRWFLNDACNISNTRRKVSVMKIFASMNKIPEYLFEEEPPLNEESFYLALDKMPPSTFQDDTYWDYAYKLYSNDNYVTWRDVFKDLCSQQKEIEMAPRYSNFDSFKRGKNEYDKKRFK